VGLLFIPLVAGVLSVFIPFTYWPEMLNWPFFLGQGWLPYRDFAIIHTPLLPSLLLVFYKLFGFNPNTLHLFGTGLIAVTALLVGLVSRSRSGDWRGVWMAQILFCLLLFAFQGNTVWFESFLTPILLGVYWCHVSYLEKPRFWKLIASGLLIGFALVTKQTVGYIFPVFLIFSVYLWQGKKMPMLALGKVILTVFIPAILIIFGLLIALYRLEVITDFWRWGAQYVFLKPFMGSHGGYVLLPTIKQSVVPMLLLLFCVVTVVKKQNFSDIYALGFMAFSFLFAFPRFEFFHLVPSAAFAAIILRKQNFKFLITTIFALVLFFQLQKYTHTFLDEKTMKIQSVNKSRYYGKSLFVLNGPDQIYFLNITPPAVKPWVPQLPWYLDYYGHQFFLDFVKGSPEVVVVSPYLNTPTRDGLGAYKPAEVLQYIQNNYKRDLQLADGTAFYIKK
jgi:4-amino-4-deoxy-L-arabinose transferase-like glycosyltransferase